MTDAADVVQRAREAIAKVNATLAAPRPPREAIEEFERSRGRVQAAARAEPAAEVARPAAGAYVSKATMDARQDAMEAAIGAIVMRERLTWLRRVAELERRLDELEKRDGDRS